MKKDDLKQKMEDAINELHQQVIDKKTPDYVKAKAAATLGRLIDDYLESFDVPDGEETRLRSVKDF